MARAKTNQFFRDSVFRFSLEPQSGQEDVGPGMPTHKAFFSLTEDDLDWLDASCWAMRRNGWHSVTRSSLIRALIRAVSDSPVQLDEVTNEDELVDALRQAIIESATDVPEDSTDAPVPTRLKDVSAQIRTFPASS